MSAAKARCPECKCSVRVAEDGRMVRHTRTSWSSFNCSGSYRTRAEILLAREQQAVDSVRNRERLLRSKIDDARKVIAEAEAALSALPKELAKAERRLEALRTRLAKGGAK